MITSQRNRDSEERNFETTFEGYMVSWAWMPAFFGKVQPRLPHSGHSRLTPASFPVILALLPDKCLIQILVLKTGGCPCSFLDPFPCTQLWGQPAVLVSCCRVKMSNRSNSGEEILILIHSCRTCDMVEKCGGTHLLQVRWRGSGGTHSQQRRMWLT